MGSAEGSDETDSCGHVEGQRGLSADQISFSFYLAMLNGVDPSPVKKIDFLKSELEKLR